MPVHIVYMEQKCGLEVHAYFFYDKSRLNHNEALLIPRWPSAGAAYVALLSFFCLQGHVG